MQSRRLSLIEAWTNGVLGFLISMVVMYFLLWHRYETETNVVENIFNVAVFTIPTILRTYLVRRSFNAYENRRT